MGVVSGVVLFLVVATQAGAAPATAPTATATATATAQAPATAPTLAPRIKIPSSAVALPAGAKPLTNLGFVPKFTPPARARIVGTAALQGFCFASKPCTLRVEGFGAAQSGRQITLEENVAGAPRLNHPVSAWSDELVTFTPLVIKRRTDPEVWTRSFTVMMRDASGAVLSNTIPIKIGSLTRPRDEDGDGHASLAAGGDDCDDHDPNRYPGNVEVADSADHDEDCDYTTFGSRDADGDGYPDASACNFDPVRRVWYCGTDCDDTNPAIFPGEQVCDARTTSAIFVCTLTGAPRGVSIDPRGPNGFWRAYDCGAFPGSTRCAPQPNGRGICQ